MVKHSRRAVGAAVASGGLVAAAAAAAPSADVAAFLALARPQPQAEVRYGPAAPQAVDVFVPEGPGPHPVAILVHGGCWNVHTAGREQLRHLGPVLAQRGIATWSIGYRRANEEGGGHPGTYTDVATAIDLLRTQAPQHRIDLARSVLVGHSAGGHLALWAAARAGLPQGSVLHTANPFLPPRVISLAGIGDLAASAAEICGADIARRLGVSVGADVSTAADAGVEASADLRAEVSPAALPPPAARVVLISARHDRLVAPALAAEHVRVMRARGMRRIEHVALAEAGHFDLVTPGTPAWAEVWLQIERALAAQHAALASVVNRPEP